MPALKHRSFRGKKSEPKKSDKKLFSSSKIEDLTAEGKVKPTNQKFKKQPGSGYQAGSSMKSSTKGKSTTTSTAKAGSNIKKSGGKNFNVGVSKGGVSFGEAFRHFKNKGVKEFTWNGKRYTTKMK
jgi:hypothetical protein